VIVALDLDWTEESLRPQLTDFSLRGPSVPRNAQLLTKNIEMLTVHHLGVSQGERVVWLCEELGLDYKIVKHTRAPLGSPESLKSIPGNELGTSPFIEDDSNGVRLSESGAVLEYLATKYGDGRLMLKPDDAHYADYLQWFHYANGTLQPAQMHYGFMGLAGVAKDNAISQLMLQRLEKRFGAVDTHLGNTKFLAGDSLTLADMMTVYSLTTQRYWWASSPIHAKLEICPDT